MPFKRDENGVWWFRVDSNSFVSDICECCNPECQLRFISKTPKDLVYIARQILSKYGEEVEQEEIRKLIQEQYLDGIDDLTGKT